MSDVVARAKKRFKRAKNAWSEIYSKAEDDLLFLSDDEFAQWDEKDYNNRVKTGRPALTIDQLGQFIHQVANDIRMNTPTINVLPSDANASQETAEVYKGLIREIEYFSNADDVYDTASLSAVKGSFGFMRVDHDYDGDTFNQRLLIKRIVNPFSIYIDPDSIECDGRDAKYGFVIDEISVEKFREAYPKFDPAGFDDEAEGKKEYKDEDTINIVEYFEIEETKEVIKQEEQEREITHKTVKRYKLSGKDELEETEFPGIYIPLIPVYGEEAWIGGKRNIYSLIRKSKSAQRMFNYWKSLETELLMKAPKAPVIAAAGQIENYAEDWKNPDKAAALRYDPKEINGTLLPPPSRLEPPTIPLGVVNAARQCVDDIKATMGIYNAGLGQVDNAVSGIAIENRQGEGDVATYHFADNLVRSITQVGRILVSAIPQIYDTARVINIVGTEDETKSVGINGQIVNEQPVSIDLTRGKYDVRVVTGASFTTKRKEASQFLATLIQSNPEFIKICGDLLFKNLDFSGAPAMAERIKKVMNPEVLGEEEVDPVVLQLQQQLQQQQALTAAIQQQLNDKQAELSIKAQSEANDAKEGMAKVQVQVQVQELRIKEQELVADIELRRRELALKERELALKEAELIEESKKLQSPDMQRIAETQSAPLT